MNKTHLLEGRRIAIVCQYFPPEGGAAANRMAFFSYWLRHHGAELSVITAMPNYPQGKIYKEYKGKFWQRELVQNEIVYRSWCYASPKRSAVRRLINYFSFMLSSLRWIRELRHCDLIIFSSGPMFAGFVAFVTNRLFGTKVLLDARDLWPDRIWETGAIHPPSWIQKILHGYTNYMYRNVEAVTCATQGLCEEIKNRVPENLPILVVRNCDQTTDNSAQPTIPRIETRKTNIRIVEAGTLGWAQDPATLCVAFQQLLENGKEHFELGFAGSGPRVSTLKKDLQALSGKAEYVGHLTQDELTTFLARADIGVVTLAATEHNLMAVSRRVYDYARAGLAIVYCGAGEGAELIEAAGAGIVIQPGEPHTLADAIYSLADDTNLLRWKLRSRRLLEGEYSAETIAGKFVDLVAKVTER